MQLQVVYTETLESPRLFQKKALNSTQGKRATPLATKEQSCKRSAVGACGTSGIKIILALVGYGFGTAGFSLNRLIQESFGRSLQARLGCHTRQSRKDFCEGKVPSLRSLETF